MSEHEYEFVAELRRWTGEAAWHFVTLPHEVTDAIDDIDDGSRLIPAAWWVDPSGRLADH